MRAIATTAGSFGAAATAAVASVGSSMPRSMRTGAATIRRRSISPATCPSRRSARLAAIATSSAGPIISWPARSIAVRAASSAWTCLPMASSARASPTHTTAGSPDAAAAVVAWIIAASGSFARAIASASPAMNAGSALPSTAAWYAARDRAGSPSASNNAPSAACACAASTAEATASAASVSARPGLLRYAARIVSTGRPSRWWARRYAARAAASGSTNGAGADGAMMRSSAIPSGPPSSSPSAARTRAGDSPSRTRPAATTRRSLGRRSASAPSPRPGARFPASCAAALRAYGAIVPAPAAERSIRRATASPHPASPRNAGTSVSASHAPASASLLRAANGASRSAAAAAGSSRTSCGVQLGAPANRQRSAPTRSPLDGAGRSIGVHHATARRYAS